MCVVNPSWYISPHQWAACRLVRSCSYKKKLTCDVRRRQVDKEHRPSGSWFLTLYGQLLNGNFLPVCFENILVGWLNEARWISCSCLANYHSSTGKYAPCPESESNPPWVSGTWYQLILSTTREIPYTMAWARSLTTYAAMLMEAWSSTKGTKDKEWTYI